MSHRLLILLAALAAVLIATVLGTVLLSQRQDPGERLLGGPVLELAPAEIVQIVVVESGRQHRLVRGEGTAWSLRGDLHDWVDPVLLAYRLADLAAARGGAVLAGTVPEDRRYEFNGPAAVRLTVTDEAGREMRLALGATNPVTGQVYASGAGRPGCFPVTKGLRDLVAGLAQSVRTQSLLPEFDPDLLSAVDLEWGDGPARLENHDGRWWLRTSGPDDPRLPRLARAYRQLYPDRWRADADGAWILASRDAVRLLVDDLTSPPARHLAEPGQLTEARTAWGLDTIWRRVTLHGNHLDPDPLADDRDQMSLAFGEPLDGETLGVLRRGLPLLAGKIPVTGLERSVGELVDLRALTLRAMDADTVVFSDEDGVLVRAARDPRQETRFDGRAAWHALPPLPNYEVVEDAHNVARFLVIDLDRLPLLAALPVSADAAVLQADETYTVSVVWNEPRHREDYVVGLLDGARVPGGVAALAPVEANPGAVGLWRPADGRLVQVTSGLFLTGRNLVR